MLPQLARLNEAAEERAPYEAFNLMMSIAANRFRDPVLDKPELADARREIGFSDLFRISVSLPGSVAGDRGGHPGPPPEAVEACADLSEGDACGFLDPRRYVEGSCVFLPGSAVALVCVPPGGPPLSLLADSNIPDRMVPWFRVVTRHKQFSHFLPYYS